MMLAAGSRLGPYEILSALGAGGMGEVYRARDAKLNRDVAIKVLLPAVATDPDQLARFSREAQVLASLNHPNIAAIYGVEDCPAEAGRHIGTDVASGFSRTIALVMELVEGEDLSQRIARGAIPLDEALPIARQIAEALEAAHDQGIIHRDLKPANVKLRPDGTVKVLDFGLAKAMDRVPGGRDFSPAGSADPAHQLANSPTLSIHATEAGIILGTAADMSPEQAAGKPVDKRSDLWAFGVVLFEMLTGRRVFGGETTSHVLAAVLKDEPAWTTLPRDTPLSIRKVLRRCLEKDRRRRLADAADARFEIEDALNPDNAIALVPAKRQWLPWSVAVLALVISGGLAWRSGGTAVSPVVYTSLDAPAGTVLGDDDFLASLPMHSPMVFTPDGKSLIIQAARDGKPQLFIRSLDRPDSRPIAGTEEARVPFVSPDGKWIGFWAAGELRRVPIEGGTPIPVTASPPTGTGRRHVAPFFLPDSKRFLFSDVSTTDAKDTRVMVQSIDGGEPRTVVGAATDGRLLSSGQLAFMRLGTLMTVAFDPAIAEIRGEAVAAFAGVMQSGLRGRNGASNTGAGMFAVSSLGALAMVKGPLTGMSENALAWGGGDGRLSSAEPVSGAPNGGRLLTRVSPDRSRALVAVQTSLRWETWIADCSRNVWTICAACGANRGIAVWSPDGQRVLVGRNDALVIHVLDGSAPDQTLVRETDRFLLPIRWLADGRLVYTASPDLVTSELRMLEAGADAGAVVIPLGISYDADVSPDGRWLAYTSAESSPANVVVQPFRGPGPKLTVSAGGGRQPAWSRDGRTLYFLDLDQPGSSVFAADVRVADRLTVGTPRQLFHVVDGQGCAIYRCYDIGDDGQFLFRERLAARRQSVNRMDLVLNWTATVGSGQ